MKNNNTMYKRLLQFFLTGLAGYDIYLASLGLFFRDNAVAYGVDFFNFNLELTTSTFWLIGLLSTYILAFAVFILLAATDPIKYIYVVYIVLGLFIVRIFQRLQFLFASSKDSSLMANTTTSDMHLLSIIVTASILLFLVVKVRNSSLFK
jgi:hypothetical protein